MTNYPEPDPEFFNEIQQSRPDRFCFPFENAAHEYAEWARDTESRVYFGIPELDIHMRGTAPGEMTTITGYSQGGKTVAALKMISHNAKNHGMLITSDETRSGVLVKMACAKYGMSAEHIEYMLQQGDAATWEMLLAIARVDYPLLRVIDNASTIGDMDCAIQEYERQFDARPKFLVYDYVELLQGEGDVPQKMNALKSFGKRNHLALFPIHQTSRSSGAAGKRLTLSSGSDGGEQQSSHIITVRRKRDKLSHDLAELEDAYEAALSEAKKAQLEGLIADKLAEIPFHENTISISLVKNKRPPCKLVPEIDFHLDPKSGALTPLRGNTSPLDGVGPGNYTPRNPF